ncbi:hypothetical protein QE3_3970 [Clostridioides difficile CD88]|uniref:Uncharacterized protein n=1 Tax=Clostridioides difficile TaxID=1496 RepID=A0A069AID6_CLODI|nr:hypothetical protein QE3_3970 [Clostridioides difficile CD88]CDS90458.1 hypothetical protein BN1097_790117 [Clostridioides difficile]
MKFDIYFDIINILVDNVHKCYQLIRNYSQLVDTFVYNF